MSTLKPGFIPAEEVSGAERWTLPLMESKSPRVTSALKERQERLRLEKERANEVIEDVVVDDVAMTPMTAEQLQAITDAAEKDGYAQGHKKGLAAGKEEGYRAGQQQGLQETKASLTKQQQRFEQMADNLFEPLAAQDDALEQSLLATVVSLAGSIVKRELFADSSHILSLVQEAIAALPVGEGHISVALNPEDMEIVEQYIAEQPHSTKKWALVPNASVMPGGCLVESDTSLVDYTVEKRLEQVLIEYSQKQLAAGGNETLSNNGEGASGVPEE